MRCFAFCGAGNACAPVSPSAHWSSVFPRTDGGCDHATGQASFEAETHNQSRCRDGAGCRRTGAFAGGERIRIRHTHCRYPAVQPHLAQSALRSWRRGNGRRQSGYVPSLRQGKRRKRRADGRRCCSGLSGLPRLWWLRWLPSLAWLRWLCGVRRMLRALGTVPLVLGSTN